MLFSINYNSQKLPCRSMKSLSNRPIGYLLGIYHLADYISGWGVGNITRSGVDQLTAIKIVFGDSRGRVTVTTPLVIGST